jgi:hypothetical protein
MKKKVQKLDEEKKTATDQKIIHISPELRRIWSTRFIMAALSADDDATLTLCQGKLRDLMKRLWKAGQDVIINMTSKCTGEFRGLVSRHGFPQSIGLAVSYSVQDAVSSAVKQAVDEKISALVEEKLSDMQQVRSWFRCAVQEKQLIGAWNAQDEVLRWLTPDLVSATNSQHTAVQLSAVKHKPLPINLINSVMQYLPMQELLLGLGRTCRAWVDYVYLRAPLYVPQFRNPPRSRVTSPHCVCDRIEKSDKGYTIALGIALDNFEGERARMKYIDVICCPGASLERQLALAMKLEMSIERIAFLVVEHSYMTHNHPDSWINKVVKFLASGSVRVSHFSFHGDPRVGMHLTQKHFEDCEFHKLCYRVGVSRTFEIYLADDAPRWPWTLWWTMHSMAGQMTRKKPPCDKLIVRIKSLEITDDATVMCAALCCAVFGTRKLDLVLDVLPGGKNVIGETWPFSRRPFHSVLERENIELVCHKPTAIAF